MINRGDTYRCSACGGTFEAGWNDDEARAEAEELFPGAFESIPMAVVCDDCWLQMERVFRNSLTGKWEIKQ